jgi:pimeloyl-ACP methyl ester carboxylesterase
MTARTADPFLELGGARLRFRDEGAGDAVLLIHGWALDLDMWAPQVAALASRYRVIRFDRRGFGLSSGAPSIERDVQDLEEVLDRLSVHRLAVLGMSQGARIALRAALAGPQPVACVVLDGPPNLLEKGPSEGPLNPPRRARAGKAGAPPTRLLDTSEDSGDIPLDRYRALARRAGVAAVRREWARQPLAQLRTRDARTRAQLARMIGRYPGRDLRRRDADSLAPVASHRLRALSAPVLVVGGACDSEARRAAADELAAAIPGARRLLVPDAGHFPNLDNPDFYNAVLGQFLKESFNAEH